MSMLQHGPANVHWYLAATKALLKFCRDHHVSDTGAIEQCLDSLDTRDWESAVRHATSQKLFGMGSLADGQVEPAFPHEDVAYVNAVFHALIKEYANAIRALAREIQDERTS
jgi:hypothetical protein